MSWANGLTAGAAAGGNGTSASAAGAGVGSGGASASADASAWGNGAGAFAGIGPAYARIVKADPTSAIVIWGGADHGPDGHRLLRRHPAMAARCSRRIASCRSRPAPGQAYQALIMATDGTDLGKPIQVNFTTRPPRSLAQRHTH